MCFLGQNKKHVFFIFYCMDRKTAMHNLCINRTVGNTHKINTIDRGAIIFSIYFANISETASNIWFTTYVSSMFRSKNSLEFYFSSIWVPKKKSYAQIWQPKCNVHGQLETYFVSLFVSVFVFLAVSRSFDPFDIWSTSQLNSP